LCLMASVSLTTRGQARQNHLQQPSVTSTVVSSTPAIKGLEIRCVTPESSPTPAAISAFIETPINNPSFIIFGPSEYYDKPKPPRYGIDNPPRYVIGVAANPNLYGEKAGSWKRGDLIRIDLFMDNTLVLSHHCDLYPRGRVADTDIRIKEWAVITWTGPVPDSQLFTVHLSKSPREAYSFSWRYSINENATQAQVEALLGMRIPNMARLIRAATYVYVDSYFNRLETPSVLMKLEIPARQDALLSLWNALTGKDTKAMPDAETFEDTNLGPTWWRAKITGQGYLDAALLISLGGSGRDVAASVSKTSANVWTVYVDIFIRKWAF